MSDLLFRSGEQPGGNDSVGAGQVREPAGFFIESSSFLAGNFRECADSGIDPETKETTMMNWYGGGMGSGAWLIMGLFWLALIGLIVWLVARLLPSSRPGSDTRESAEEILDRRFAMGEIDMDTYSAQRAALVAAKRGRQ